MAAGSGPLERCGERLARLVASGRSRGWADDRVGAASQARSKARSASAQAEFLRPGPDLGHCASSATGRASSVRDGTAWRSAMDIRRGQRRLDPTSELILTILTQNSADTGADGGLRGASVGLSGHGRGRGAQPRPRLGGVGLPDGIEPDWAAVEFAPLPSWSRRSGRRARQPEGATDPGEPCGGSARSAATTSSNSSVTCRPSRLAIG